jgi:hypothetical protein
MSRDWRDDKSLHGNTQSRLERRWPPDFSSRRALRSARIAQTLDGERGEMSTHSDWRLAI